MAVEILPFLIYDKRLHDSAKGYPLSWRNVESREGVRKLANEPEVKLVKETENKAYIGNFVFYKDNKKGCAFIVEIPTISNRVFVGKTVMSWEDVSREEGWGLINEWAQ